MCAQYYGHRVVGIVEGPNYGGKTTLMKQLRDLVPSSKTEEFHDFYHHQFMRLPEFGRVFTIDHILHGAMPSEVVAEVVHYNHARLVNAVERMRKENLDPFLFERLHATDWVYQKLLFGIDDFAKYIPLEEQLNAAGAFLILMTAPDEIIRERMQQNQRAERQVHSQVPIPLHLTNVDMALRKKELYEEFFGRTTVKRKALVSSTNGEDYTELLRSFLRP